MEITKSFLKDLTYHINVAAIEVHKSLGPGLLENVYHQCIKHELKLRNINFSSEISVPVNYKGFEFITDLRCDLLVENCVVVELKVVEDLIPIHCAQLLTYMKLLKVPRVFLLILKSQTYIMMGKKTFVNEHYNSLK